MTHDLSQRVANLSPAKLRLLMKHLGKDAPDPGEEPRRRSGAGPVPLSFSQQRLWFLDRLEPGGTAYSLPSALRLAGRLDLPALAAALTRVVARHEVLRTTCAERGGDPVQVIHPPAPLALPVADLSALPAERAEAETRRLARAEGRRPFDLARGPLFRNLLLRLAGREHVLLQNLHHIVSDAWSRTLMVREMVGLYEALAAGRRPALAAPALQYGDYCVWQRERLAGPALETLLGWWRERLQGAPQVEMPADRPRLAERTGAGAVARRPLAPGLPERLGEVGRGTGATLFMTLLSGLAALVHRHTGETDLVLGTPIANRREAALEGVLGFFVNTLALRLDAAGDPTFRELVGRVRETALDSYARQELPFEKLVEELAPERVRGRSPLFQGLFVQENVPPARLEIPGLTFTALETDNGAAKFDWGLSVEESPDGWRLRLEYATDLYDTATAERWLDHYGRLLAAAAARPDLRLSELPLLGDGERRQVVAGWNATAREYAGADALPARLAAQAAATPQATALVFGGERLTYADFETRVCRLARHLGTLGIGPESRVGVFAERGVEMVEAIHAVVRAGAAYVPLDPGNPAERLAFMVEDAGLSLVLVGDSVADRLPAVEAPRLLLGADRERWAGEEPTAPRVALTGENAAYVIYTSGSTGRPKGVVNRHRAIVNRLDWMQETFPLDASDRVLQKTPASFDVSVWELFWPLLAGATLVVAKPEGHKDPAYLADLIARERVTTLHFVPSMLAAFLEHAAAAGHDALAERGAPELPALRRVIASGEALPAATVRRFFARLPSLGAPAVELHNLYGPTEAAVDVSWHACSPGEERVPIGRPIANLRLHVVDRHLEPQPVGVPGELLLGGVGLARGYLARTALTAERFVPDPFAAEPGSRLYRTGDLARWLPDGEVEFLGRLDHQVKVRGHRIELGEIETALAERGDLAAAVVLPTAGPAGDTQLTAYVVPAPGVAPTAEAIHRDLARHLPEVMIPAAFAVLDALPLTPNGKVDRRALAAVATRRLGRATPYVAPRNDTEERLAALWCDLLEVERVGVDDNFFHLGGHSLLATRLLGRVRDAFGIDLPLAAFFEAPTVADLAESLEVARWMADGEPSPVAVGEEIEEGVL